MAGKMVILQLMFCLILAGPLAAGQVNLVSLQLPSNQQDRSKAATPAEDISGMYSFLKEGEFLQINLDKDGVSGYISRMGELESDRGTFLDHFFTKAAIRGHDVTFTTRQVHGVWFDFKGKFDRGPGKTKSQDGYYVLRGTLTEFTADPEKRVTSRSREVEFKLLAQPDDDEPQAKPKK
ncbi:MAG TPA: hypothetical protein VKE93_13035 [Candidatus Angelobacter sp.]|nr:hypothetical protein [Candidatus Angelobacter sp.]